MPIYIPAHSNNSNEGYNVIMEFMFHKNNLSNALSHEAMQ